MSRFGDGTPHEALLNAAEDVQDDFCLTDRELVIILLKVLQYKNDPFDDENDKLRERKAIQKYIVGCGGIGVYNKEEQI